MIHHCYKWLNKPQIAGIVYPRIEILCPLLCRYGNNLCGLKTSDYFACCYFTAIRTFLRVTSI
jgi:hypothetical protein